MDAAFIERLQVARSSVGMPFWVKSGWRCESHNKAVGGRMNSSHLRGLAADIRVQNSHELYSIVKSLICAGFTRIGVAGSFVHVDIDAGKVQDVMWTY